MKKHYFVISLFIIFLSCKSKVSSDNNFNETINYELSNGSYCANVDYYNAKTNFTNSYIFNVEVENNKLVKINFPNEGWLDETHFTPPSVDNQGITSFSTFEGLKYKVRIIKNLTNCVYSASNPTQDEEKFKKETFTTINKYVVLIAEGTYSQTSYIQVPDMSPIHFSDNPPMVTKEVSGIYPIKSAILRSIALRINQYDGTLEASSAELLNQYLTNYELQVSQETQSGNSADINKSFPKVAINKSYYKLFDDETKANEFIINYRMEALKLNW